MTIAGLLAGFGSSGALYDFVNATFTPGGVTGRNGPSLAQAVSGLAGTNVNSWKNNTTFFNTSSGIQLWTVPATRVYRIEAFGAGGSRATTYAGNLAGLGAKIQGDFTLNQGEIIRILVGQSPGTDTPFGGSGGGGTFVIRSPYNTTDSILAIAGGGGGSGGRDSRSGVAGTTSTSGTTNGIGTGAPGSNGSGGSAGSGSQYYGGGGGGFSGNATGLYGGLSFTNGGTGGAGGPNYPGPGGGGFGGGGGSNFAGGAGGGYSGGAGGPDDGSTYAGGGGGGSYNSGANQVNTAGVRSGSGQVIITAL